MRILFVVLKFTLLSLVYFFILRIFYFIITDLRHSSKEGETLGELTDAGIGAELVVTESTVSSLKPGDVVRLGGETRIGRGRNNDLKIPDNFVSHNHAIIIFKEQNFFLEDLNSINGTYINGVRVRESSPLKTGDSLKISGVTFKFARWEYEVG
ncbi:MAG TPA: FHA domain-containing protein [Desulfobacteria bacterium]|nr:FHA domain-containing protein [Desulfobacteria bacterium]